MDEFILRKNGVYYRTNGFLPHRPTLVFIHGLTGSSSAWIAYENIFENKYNLLTIDLRGHGKSAKPCRYEDYEIGLFAEDVHDILGFLKLKKYIIISHSFGTLVTLELLYKYEKEVAATIFLSPNFGIKTIWLAHAIKFLIGWCVNISKIFPCTAKIGWHVDYSKYPNTGDWNLRRMAADIPNTGLRTYLYCLKHIYNFSHEEYWSKISIPTLIIHGKKDTIVPIKNALGLAGIIKNSKLVILDNANHIIVLNNVKEVADAIENFIGNLTKKI
ncbi:MAG: alpha/beta hydrolase [Patescibacteria group bacterium]|nr:alpha/beta hydrolase [Patescibacteria group bacterium]MDE2015285.1 alpha/beta hydrolase [Patescibacteria group bacterium]MDE2227091.1 alpha/beta hydrolase [Patescibacteria group bacterium]